MTHILQLIILNNYVLCLNLLQQNTDQSNLPRKILTYTPTALFTLKEVKTGTETGKELGDRSSTHNGQVYPHQTFIGLPTVRSHEGIFLIDYWVFLFSNGFSLCRGDIKLSSADSFLPTEKHLAEIGLKIKIHLFPPRNIPLITMDTTLG